MKCDVPEILYGSWRKRSDEENHLFSLYSAHKLRDDDDESVAWELCVSEQEHNKASSQDIKPCPLINP